ncbi:MAG: hypothetical protein ACLPYS_14010 [Vulcanimicrobiaceae bacterium]
MIRRALRGERLISFESDLEVTRSLPHGHVAAVLGMMRALDLERIIDRTPSRMRSLALALICQRVLRAGSKAAYARMLDDTTLAEELGVVGADEDALYEALDYLANSKMRSSDDWLSGMSATGCCCCMTCRRRTLKGRRAR